MDPNTGETVDLSDFNIPEIYPDEVTGEIVNPGEKTSSGATYLGAVIPSKDGTMEIWPDGTIIHFD